MALLKKIQHFWNRLNKVFKMVYNTLMFKSKQKNLQPKTVRLMYTIIGPFLEINYLFSQPKMVVSPKILHFWNRLNQGFKMVYNTLMFKSKQKNLQPKTVRLMYTNTGPFLESNYLFSQPKMVVSPKHQHFRNRLNKGFKMVYNTLMFKSKQKNLQPKTVRLMYTNTGPFLESNYLFSQPKMVVSPKHQHFRNRLNKGFKMVYNTLMFKSKQKNLQPKTVRLMYTNTGPFLESNYLFSQPKMVVSPKHQHFRNRLNKGFKMVYNTLMFKSKQKNLQPKTVRLMYTNTGPFLESNYLFSQPKMVVSPKHQHFRNRLNKGFKMVYNTLMFKSKQKNLQPKTVRLMYTNTGPFLESNYLFSQPKMVVSPKHQHFRNRLNKGFKMVYNTLMFKSKQKNLQPKTVRLMYTNTGPFLESNYLFSQPKMVVSPKHQHFRNRLNKGFKMVYNTLMFKSKQKNLQPKTVRLMYTNTGPFLESNYLFSQPKMVVSPKHQHFRNRLSKGFKMVYNTLMFKSKQKNLQPKTVRLMYTNTGPFLDSNYLFSQPKMVVSPKIQHFRNRLNQGFKMVYNTLMFKSKQKNLQPKTVRLMYTNTGPFLESNYLFSQPKMVVSPKHQHFRNRLNKGFKMVYNTLMFKSKQKRFHPKSVGLR